MRKRTSVALALLAAVALAGPSGVLADPAEEQARTEAELGEALAGRAAARVELRRLEARLAELQARAAALERRVGRAALRVIDALRAEAEAERRLEAAQDRLRDRAQAAYVLGPAGALDLFLSADSMADLIAMRDFADAAVGVDSEAVAVAAQARAELEAVREAAERARAPLIRQETALRELLTEIRFEVARARETAERAGLQVRRLEVRQAELQEAIDRAEQRDRLYEGGGGGGGGGSFAEGVDQSELLALLGPSGGRTCDVPDGLVETGTRLRGLATWYGWEFAGQPTASGATFDPRLFTAAHRTLPLGTFLRVRHGGRCAIVLVNDRGPFGDERRIIDLSMAAARYLGVGVSQVTADVLVRG